MTPAMASEPYWAAAPSRNTSMRSIALVGILLKSTAALPLPTFDSVLMTELTWRRFPLTRTSTWSGLKPLNWADLTISVWPELDWRGMLKEATAACNKPPSSPAILGDLTRSSAVMISTGTRLSSTARSWERVPMVTISSISLSAAEPDSCATGWNAQIDRDNRVTAGTVMRLLNGFIISTSDGFLDTERKFYQISIRILSYLPER